MDVFKFGILTNFAILLSRLIFEKIEKSNDLIDKMNNICIIGDLMVDKYIQHECKRISPEAAVPVLINPKMKRCLGAANVAKNSLNIIILN